MNFLQFAELHGVVVRRLFASEKIQRCATVEHPQKRNGAYWFNGRSGWVWNWEHGQESVAWWDDPNAKPPTAAELAAARAERRKAQIALERRQERAARISADMIASCQHKEHGYLERKGGGKAHQIKKVKGLVNSKDELIVPVRNYVGGAITGMQRIYFDDGKWVKEFEPGTRADMGVFVLGRGAIEIGCEGYATGLSLRAAADNAGLDVAVVVCFSAGNLARVAAVGKMKCVFADNDVQTEYQKQHGIEQTGHKIAKQIGLPWASSPVEGEDANDLHVRAGILALQAIIVRLVGECQ